MTIYEIQSKISNRLEIVFDMIYREEKNIINTIQIFNLFKHDIEIKN